MIKQNWDLAWDFVNKGQSKVSLIGLDSLQNHAIFILFFFVLGRRNGLNNKIKAFESFFINIFVLLNKFSWE